MGLYMPRRDAGKRRVRRSVFPGGIRLAMVPTYGLGIQSDDHTSIEASRFFTNLSIRISSSGLCLAVPLWCLH